MRAWALAPAVLMAAVSMTACHNPFGREYEYEEQLYLGVDGSASVVIDSSIAALVALRGLPLETAVSARFDPLALERMYESTGCHTTRIGLPWYRHGRRFIQIRLETDNIRTLGTCGPLAWSTYEFDQTGGEIRYRQTVGKSAASDPGNVNWTGGELVAFKLHLPAKVTFHNVRRLEDNSTGEIARGNILTWEQRLADRRAGTPVEIQLTMEQTSILYRTLWLFGGSFVAAVTVLAGLIWWTIRTGKARARAGQAPGTSSTH